VQDKPTSHKGVIMTSTHEDFICKQAAIDFSKSDFTPNEMPVFIAGAQAGAKAISEKYEEILDKMIRFENEYFNLMESYNSLVKEKKERELVEATSI
jgi:hypothetical protein